MRIAILSYGTRGDVQPMVAIAHALRLRGHDVILGAPENHLAFARVAGVEVSPISGDSDALLDSPAGKAWVREGNLLALARAMITLFERLCDDVERDCERITAGADVIVAGALAAAMGRLFSEVLNVPFIAAHMFPLLPSRSVPNGMIGGRSLGPLNGPLGRLVAHASFRALGRIDNAARARRGLPLTRQEPLTAQFDAGRPSIHLWSPTLVPRPPDWPNEHVTGACTLTATLRADLGERRALAEIDEFLGEGPAPFYVGLGSMPIDDPAPLLDGLARSLEAFGMRALVGGTFRDRAAVAARLPTTMRLCPAVDHDALFPRCAGVVHHGGAGTTHAGLRAGRPTMICTVLGDQPFWGRRVAALGAGTWLRFRDLTERAMYRGLAKLMEPSVVAAAAAIGERMRAEPDGASAAASAIEQIVDNQRARAT